MNPHLPPAGYCHYCGKWRTMTRDHIIPKARGGTNKIWNFVGACQACNSRKGDDLPSCTCQHCQTAIDNHWQHIMGFAYPVRLALMMKVADLYSERHSYQYKRLTYLQATPPRESIRLFS